MIITCPSCKVQYQIDPNLLGFDGKTVRCFKCQHIWVQDRPAPAAVVEDLDGDVGDFVEDIVAPLGSQNADINLDEFGLGDLMDGGGNDGAPGMPALPPGEDFEDFVGGGRKKTAPQGPYIAAARRKAVSTFIGWTIFLGVLFGSAGGAFFYRDIIQTKWPESQRLYRIIGMANEAPGAGLELRNVKSERQREGEDRVLVIEGEIANVEREPREVPLLEGALTGADGSALHKWTFSIRQTNLLPGESVPFKTRVVNPPSGAAGLAIAFVAGPREPAGTPQPGESAAPEAAAETTPGATPETAPGATPETTTPDATPGTTPQTDSGTSSSSMPADAPATPPATTPEAAPAPQTAPNSSAGST